MLKQERNDVLGIIGSALERGKFESVIFTALHRAVESIHRDCSPGRAHLQKTMTSENNLRSTATPP